MKNLIYPPLNTSKPSLFKRAASLVERMRPVAFAFSTFLALLAGGSPAAAQVNGDFEVGDLSGWTSLTSDTISIPSSIEWANYTGTTPPVHNGPGFDVVQAPPQGSRAAIAASNYFGWTILYRDITLTPAMVHTLKFQVYYRNYWIGDPPLNNDFWITPPDSATALTDADPFNGDRNQQYRVDIVTTSAPDGSTLAGDVLLNLFKTVSMDPAVLAPTEITADLSAFAGQTVRLRFAVAQTENILNGFVDNVRLISAPVNQPPTAVPGNAQTVMVGTLASLNGSGSLDDNTPSGSLGYAWSFFSVPVGNTATLAGAGTATPSFTPNVPGNYVLQLIVTDTGAPPLSSTAAFVTVTSVNQVATFLVIDDDTIDNTSPAYYLPPNTGSGTNGREWSASDVNDDLARLGRRTPLRFFNNPANFGRQIVIRSGQVGDEGMFALKVIPSTWASAGPTTNGLKNYIGAPCLPFPHNVGKGLGTGSDPESRLDKIPKVTPLRATGLKGLIGHTVCAIVYDSDISMNYGPLNGSLKGDTLGVVAFKVIEVKKAIGFSSSTLPLVTIEIVDPCQAFQSLPTLYLTAPEPTSSSTPNDITP